MKNNIDFRLKTKDEFPVQFSTYEKFLMMHLLRRKFDEILQEYPRIAFFGIGSHTKWFVNILTKKQKEKIIAIIDMDPPARLDYFDLPPTKAKEWSYDDADAIILSTVNSQSILIERCTKLYGENIPLIDLYEEELKW